MTEDAMISVLSNATRIVCGDMTAQHLTALHASVDQASCLPARPDWKRKAAAHAEIFNVLADIAADQATRALLSRGAGFVFDLMIAAGRAADGMAANSRERFLSRLHVAEWEDAALEMERHLRALHFMWRLADSARPGPGLRRVTNRGRWQLPAIAQLGDGEPSQVLLPCRRRYPCGPD